MSKLTQEQSKELEKHGQTSIDTLTEVSEDSLDEELWAPMIAYATHELKICLNSMETRSDHNDDRIAQHSVGSVAKRLREVSDSLYRVLAINKEYNELLSLFQKQS